MALRIGVDSGGTFTDVCLFDEETGKLDIWKVPSTPDDPSRGISDGVSEGLATVASTAAHVAFLGHGTTVATNALIELKGVATGLITTDGFRDLLEIGRQKRPSLYDMNAEKPETLVSRDRRQEVPERLKCDGSEDRVLDEDKLRAAVRKLAEEDVKAIAVCFLYGFLNNAHEKRVVEILREEMPDVFVSASHEVAPEFREYERMSTTVVNAYLGPVMQRYIDRLKLRLSELGVPVAPQLTQSNGGVIGFDMAAQLPVRTVLSGPSTGVVAAQAVGRMAGFDNIITFDVGGTSSDVALLQGGVCKLTGEANVHGYPIKAPMLDIHTVGAGGGSIAFVDSGGLLKVGPRSAGADPGPVCYGRGNTEATVTDANIVLQTLNPVEILGGRMKVRRDLAIEAVQRLADQLGLGLMETAQGIISVVTANMAKAIRLISVQRGHDPRDYALMAFGGAGPLHAARLAKELDMSRMIVPLTPGTLCALGLLLTDLRSDFAISRLMKVSQDAVEPMISGFEALEAQADAWFAQEDIEAGRRIVNRTADVRYVGQNYELQVSVTAGTVGADTLDALIKGFEQAHLQRFGFIAEGEQIQIVTLRLEAVGVVNKAEFVPQPDAGLDCQAAVIGSRQVYMDEAKDFVSCPVYTREKLKPGNRIAGPAIVEQMDTTTVILPDMQATVDPYLNLILEAQS
ncbi:MULTISPECIES: hydantoinase/oxoprolinase family protein [Rhizobium]|uniref:Hydantoin utilization protein A n=1 Tax=Rhizobium rhizogenes NBRC 13257 TaxID=1220581 RepID=A0AA87U6R2_RHIRH|nr:MULTISPECIES: hydantoinase/oxoprolinase family protein [Rhizobium]MBO9126516.1 hydantoinase/oxoprolinase family protein [Rhizobium sp. 16-488-2b]MBO9178451.1 hydantoinase/oxoprolinase family protein [Rhizobium sp. 16-488-2a]MBO9194996.1 hydantoinase/oxoprolinase family protein [Rhizobium sp. 16-449-1b]NTG71398.1 hydantoinase/oxoprolinase family protein [Rhizobium rhizogenes]TRB05084.1 hydantoinase/oxoprolinase family protein [Rhizobium rhizogenes]